MPSKSGEPSSLEIDVIEKQRRLLAQARRSAAHQGSDKGTLLNMAEQHLSEFAVCENLTDLLDVTRDTLWRAPSVQKPSGYLNDIGTGAYILVLRDALVVPGDCIHPPSPDNFAKSMPAGLKRRSDNVRPTHLLLTSENKIVTDSFMRCKGVPAGLRHVQGKGWCARLESEADVVEETSVYRELISPHFGHLLIDVPGRAWSDLFDPEGLLVNLAQVGFGINGMLPGQQTDLPGYATALLRAFGMNPDRFKMPVRPTRYRRLIVPARIAPFGTAGGALFNQLAQRAGDRLTVGMEAQTGLPHRVFLSRSRLIEGTSRIVGEPEERLDTVFEKAGFTVVHSQQMSLADQVNMIRGARQVAGVVGSQLHLVAFSRRPGVQVVEVRPDHWHNPCNQRIVTQLGGEVISFDIAARESDMTSSLRGGLIPMNLTEATLKDLAAFLGALQT